MFENAVRNKFRFQFRGQCSVEDLWDLDVQDLDTIFKNLTRQAKASAEESLLDEKSKESMVLAAKIEIVKHIVAVKLVERKAFANAVIAATHKQKLLGIIADKQDESLKAMTIEELQGLVSQTAVE